MKTSLLLILFTIAAFSSARSADITSLRSEYETRLSAIQTSYETQVRSLEQDYVAELQKLLKAVKKKGDLDETSAIMNEIERCNRKEKPSPSALSKPASLSKLQSAYENAISSFDTRRAQQIDRLAQEADKSMELLQKTLVAADKLAEAKAVQNERRDISQSVPVLDARQRLAGIAAIDRGKNHESTLVVEALIDGATEFRVSTNGVYWSVSRAVAKPGKHGNRNEPTFVNGKIWQPKWGNPKDGARFDKCQMYPITLTDLSPQFKLLAVSSTRGGAEIESRSPVKAGRSGAEYVVEISDLESGPRWYRFSLSSQGREVSNSIDPNISGFGSGFIVSTDGYVITCHHVVADARKIAVMLDEKAIPARLVDADAENDFALLKIDGSFQPVTFASEEQARLGQSVFTLGFPMPDIQGRSPKVTKGVISSIKGSMDDIRMYQIDASVQPGNSGGPLFDESGNVLGMVVARLNLLSTANIAQNVNYCVKKSYILAFLGSHAEVVKKIQEGSTKNQGTFEQSVELAGKSVVMIVTY